MWQEHSRQSAICFSASAVRLGPLQSCRHVVGRATGITTTRLDRSRVLSSDTRLELTDSLGNSAYARLVAYAEEGEQHDDKTDRRENPRDGVEMQHPYRLPSSGRANSLSARRAGVSM
jgi:hypothetical protein